MLIGRERELRKLESFWAEDSFDIAVVYGRRRIGKSFLLRNFAEGRKSIFFQATTDEKQNLAELSRLVSAISGSSAYISYPDYSAAFSEIGTIAKKDKLLFIIDELSFLSDSNKDVLSVLQFYTDNSYMDTKLKLILCSSHSSFMEERVISGSSPLFGRTSLRLKLQNMTPAESTRFFSGWPLENISDAHIIAGGVPHYLKRLARYSSLEEAIHEEFFTVGCPLLSEPILLLYKWTRNTSLYFQIINAIATGTTHTSKIADKLQIEQAQASAMLRSLTSFGITGKKENAVIKAGRGGRWQITDNFFAFWAEFVFPAMPNIETDNAEAAFNKAINSLPQFTGRHIEKDIRKYILAKSERIISEYGSAEFPNPQEKTNEELDFIARCDGGTYLFGEFKWRRQKTGISTLDDLKRKAVIAVPKNVEREYYLCSEAGFTEELEEASQRDKTLHLITGEDLFSIT